MSGRMGIGLAISRTLCEMVGPGSTFPHLLQRRDAMNLTGNLRMLLWPLAQAATIVLMGPVILALAGNSDVSWSAAIASFRFTGPLGAVVFGGQVLLRWSEPKQEA